MQNPEYVQLAASALEQRLPRRFLDGGAPIWGIVLGTGLGADLGLDGAVDIPFAALPHFPASSVESHAGRFIAGFLGGARVVVQSGRCHLYEGRSPFEICMGIRAMGLLGCRRLVITNAAGALNPLFDAGSLMLIRDIINHTGASPLAGGAPWGPRFTDMSEPLSKRLANAAAAAALAAGIKLEQGVYIGVHGPEMETPAETRMYRQWGADAVGMSSVLEIIAARQMGIECLGISCLTNKNLPDCMRPAPIEEVVAAAESAAPELARLIRAVIAAQAATPPMPEPSYLC